MSSYKTGKPLIVISASVLVAAVIIAVVASLASFSLLDWDNEPPTDEFALRISIDYFKNEINNSNNITAKYKDVEYTVFSQGFKDYYINSHSDSVPITDSIPESHTSLDSINGEISDNILFTIKGNDCSYKATYYSDINKFELVCIYSSLIGGKKFYYNSQLHFNDLVGYLVS